MLDHEPEPQDQNDASSPAPAQASAASPPPRRRRAASRPAGPPAPREGEAPADPEAAVASEPGQTSAEPLAAEAPEPLAPEAPEPLAAEAPEPLAPEASEPVAEPAPAKKAAKRAPAKRATKKVAEPEAGSEAPAAPKTTRRRTTKKAAAAPAVEASSEPADAETAVPDAPVALAPETDEPPLLPTSATDPEPAEPAAEAASEPPAAAPDSAIEAALQGLASSVDGQSGDADPTDESPDVEEPEAQDTETGAAEAGDPDDVDDDDVDDGEADDLETDESAGHDDGEGSRRRRRRRGGRRRRRSGGDEDAADQGDPAGDPVAAAAEAPAPESGGEGSPDASEPETEEAEGQGSGRRRRRRRRRGEDTGSAEDDPTEVVVRVREPRTRKKASEVTGIDGSTRLEAKRQRRREGREAGRRRPPILSEAEFLARRESVERTMVIRQRDDLTQIAVLEDGILVEHYVDRDSAASLIGNVYLGRVQNVLPSMEAAFIDIGRGRNAVLYAGEVDWDSFGAEGQARKVEKVFKSGQTVLVQVTKDPVGAKGARLTNHVSIPGRYIVYAPGGHLSGISRKLPDIERKRLKDILAELVGESASVIVRTAAEGASEEELVRDVNRLKAQWSDIEKKVASGSAPQLLYGEPDLTVRIVRDLFTEDFGQLIIQGNGGMNDAYEAVDAYVRHVAPHLGERLSRYEPEASEGDGEGEEQDLFTRHRLDEQIARALERKVYLPSGGSLVIDRTEAMTVIDVNTGKFTGSGGNLEATVTSNNLEAAEEIVRQLRLRDIGGIIVIDFIDMVLPSNRELLLRRLVECLGRDRTRHQVAEVTSLGLVQMTRKKIGTGLLEAFTTECQQCAGRGYELHDAPVETQKLPDGGTRPAGRDRPRGPSRSRRGSGDGNGASDPAPSSPAEVAAGRS